MKIKFGRDRKPLMVRGKVVTNCNCCAGGGPGACCTDGVCSDVGSQSECESGGGFYLGEGTACGADTCTCWLPPDTFNLSQIDVFGSVNVSSVGGSSCESHICPPCDISSACGPYPGDGCAHIDPDDVNCRATMSCAIETNFDVTQWRLVISGAVFCGSSCTASQATAWFDIATVIPTGTFFFSWGCGGDTSFSAVVTIAP